ncbi:hypothetical protein FA13DRAFT_1730167 [Coprinellus micaceus]|uniref:Uncharacterized protein n=1 Tax=Coprinellus micaceus TaxID=71717 RepID=A0A4Y7TI91_COPMI|nr:hypothetical protein FA13DRAFT_1730167 [Coprinellus micaceus]
MLDRPVDWFPLTDVARESPSCPPLTITPFSVGFRLLLGVRHNFLHYLCVYKTLPSYLPLLNTT